MNNKQKAKLTTLANASADAEIEAARAAKAVEEAGDDPAKKADAEEALRIAEANRDEAKKAHDDYTASLDGDTKKNGGANDTKPSGKKAGGKTITVTAARDRRRAGLAFPKGSPVTLDLADLDDDQIKALEDDPVLAISSK